MATNNYTRSQCSEFTIATLNLFMLSFADDLVLLAPSVLSLQKLISLFSTFCTNNNLVINTKKTEVMLV